MSGVHVLHVPTVEISRTAQPARWCFYCRKRVAFTLKVSLPDDPMSYYGPSAEVVCEHGHVDGDCFPGTWREWDDDLP